MTQLLGCSNSPCRLSNMLVFPIKPFLLFFLPLKSKEVRTLAKGVDFPRPRLDQPVLQSSRMPGPPGAGHASRALGSSGQ